MQRIEAIRHMAQVVNQGFNGRGITIRTFGLDPTGRMLVAASQIPLPVRDGASVKMLSAGLSVYRIRANGELDFVRKYDVDVGGKNQFSFGSGTHLSFTEAASNLSGTPTVTDGVHTASITLLGQYMAGQFTSASDGHDGTLIGDPTAAAASDPNLGTLAAQDHA